LQQTSRDFADLVGLRARLRRLVELASIVCQIADELGDDVVRLNGPKASQAIGF
jgi:hypothetical protein